MSLRRDTRQNVQLKLDFPSTPTGEAQKAETEAVDSRPAVHATESPASTNRLMEEACERENLKEALRRVKVNKGSPGVDGMTIDEITDYLKQHWPAIRGQLLNGTYEPQADAAGGNPQAGCEGVRKLGIPPVLDRFIQQGVMQVLQRRWDQTFSDHCYGFRPKRSAHLQQLITDEVFAAGSQTDHSTALWPVI